MEKFNLLKNRALGLLLIVFTVAFFVSCDNGDDDDGGDETELLGDWMDRSVFDGVARGNSASFTIGDRGYIVGGFDGRTFYDDAWAFDRGLGSEQVDGFWFRVDSFPGVPRSGAVAFAINGRGYVGTGLDENGELLSDFYEFDPTAGEVVNGFPMGAWSQIADFPDPEGRFAGIGFSIGNFGYVGTGSNGSDQKDFWQYDPASDAWTQIVGYGGDKRRNATVFVVNDIAYVGTGENNGQLLNDLYSYDGSTWVRLTDIDINDDNDVSVLITNATGFAIDGQGYIATGDIGAVSGSVFEYTPEDDSWSQLGGFEGTSREGAISFSFGDAGYVGLGFLTTSDYFDDLLELVDPDAEQE